MSYYRVESRGLTFPYDAKSPTLRKVITYDEDQLWSEIYRILDEGKDSKFTPGAELYYNLMLCADSSYFIDREMSLMLEEYMAMKKFNIPLATEIYSAIYDRVVIFSAIDDEYQAIIRKEQDVQK